MLLHLREHLQQISDGLLRRARASGCEQYREGCPRNATRAAGLGRDQIEAAERVSAGENLIAARGGERAQRCAARCDAKGHRRRRGTAAIGVECQHREAKTSSRDDCTLRESQLKTATRRYRERGARWRHRGSRCGQLSEHLAARYRQ